MSRTVLIAALAASVLAVGVIAALTVTVIVHDDGGGRVAVRMQAAPVSPPLAPGQGQRTLPGLGPGLLPGLGPGMRQVLPRPQLTPGPLQGLRACLQKQGLALPRTGSSLDPQKLRSALQSCLGSLQGTR